MLKREVVPALLIVTSLALAHPAVAEVVQNAQVREFQDTQDSIITNPAIIAGSHAQLVRRTNGVSVRLGTRDLPPGAYTLWWEVYNAPENCIGPCDFLQDAFNPATHFSVFWAAGGIVGSDGQLHVKAETLVGDPPGEACPVIPFAAPKMLFGCGLLNPLGAQINVIIKTHGAPNNNAEVLYRQVGSIGGVCTNPPGPIDHPVDPDPVYQIFPCYDPQVAVFRPL
jgi:hypothetical protein